MSDLATNGPVSVSARERDALAARVVAAHGARHTVASARPLLSASVATSGVRVLADLLLSVADAPVSLVFTRHRGVYKQLWLFGDSGCYSAYAIDLVRASTASQLAALDALRAECSLTMRGMAEHYVASRRANAVFAAAFDRDALVRHAYAVLVRECGRHREARAYVDAALVDAARSARCHDATRALFLSLLPARTPSPVLTGHRARVAHLLSRDRPSSSSSPP